MTEDEHTYWYVNRLQKERGKYLTEEDLERILQEGKDLTYEQLYSRKVLTEKHKPVCLDTTIYNFNQKLHILI